MPAFFRSLSTTRNAGRSRAEPAETWIPEIVGQSAAIALVRHPIRRTRHVLREGCDSDRRPRRGPIPVRRMEPIYEPSKPHGGWRSRSCLPRSRLPLTAVRLIRTRPSRFRMPRPHLRRLPEHPAVSANRPAEIATRSGRTPWKEATKGRVRSQKKRDAVNLIDQARALSTRRRRPSKRQAASFPLIPERERRVDGRKIRTGPWIRAHRHGTRRARPAWVRLKAKGTVRLVRREPIASVAGPGVIARVFRLARTRGSRRVKGIIPGSPSASAYSALAHRSHPDGH